MEHIRNKNKIKQHSKHKNPQKQGLKWWTIFQKNSGGVSSKRVIALVGVGICFGLLISGYISEKDIPEFAEVVFIGCLSLYGIDVIPTWSKQVVKNS